MIVGVPQTLSIALGAALISLVDYRLLIVVMSAVDGAVRAVPRHGTPPATSGWAR